jgi:hypothetical protein
MSDYEWLVQLAAKGMAERDNHPMPKSVTTPEAFYEIMARAALEAMGLQALLNELAEAVRLQKGADEGSHPAVNAESATTMPEEPADCPQHVSYAPPGTPFVHEKGVRDTAKQRERATRKVAGARLRSK